MAEAIRAAKIGLLALMLASPVLSPAAAQPGDSADITAVDTASFPDINAYVSVSHPSSRPMPGLPRPSFQLLENSAPVGIADFGEEEHGLQSAFVVESSSVFSKRDPPALTRLDYVKTAIINFAVGDSQSRPFMKDGLDAASLYAPQGPILEHSTVGGEIRNALITDQSDFLFETGLSHLIRRAIEAVTKPLPRAGLRRQIVVFSSGSSPTADAEESAAAARATATLTPIPVTRSP